MNTSNVAGIALFFMAACSSQTGHDSLVDVGATWVDASGGETDLVQTFRGAAHCDWESVIILRISSEVIPPAYAADMWSDFVRDPDGVLPAGLVDGDLDVDTTVPGDAVEAGYSTTTGVEIWVDHEDPNAIFVGADQRTERWPRGNAGCD